MDDGFDYYLYENKPPETLRERVWCWLYARREQIVKLYLPVQPYRIPDLEHEAGLMDSGLYDPPGEPPEDDVALEMELARWRRENPLPEPVDDGLPW